MKKACALLAVLLFAAASHAADKPAPADVVTALQELRTELEWPGLTADEAAKNLKTPQEAFRFVRDEIMLVNYRGSYAGADGGLFG